MAPQRPSPLDRYLPSCVYLRLFYRCEGASWTVLSLHPQRRSTRGQPFGSPSWYRAMRSCLHVTQSRELDFLVPLLPAACYTPRRRHPARSGVRNPGHGARNQAVRCVPMPCIYSQTPYREAGLEVATQYGGFKAPVDVVKKIGSWLRWCHMRHASIVISGSPKEAPKPWFYSSEMIICRDSPMATGFYIFLLLL